MMGFDWVILAVFIVSTLVGMMRGFVKEALSITSWIVSIWLAITYSSAAGDFIASYVSIPASIFRTTAGFVLIFVGTLFVFSLANYLISKVLVRGPIKSTDRVLGLGFGALRAAAVVVLILIIARGMGMESSDWWQNSKYLSYFEPTANYVESLLPSQMQSDDQNIEQTTEQAVQQNSADNK